MSPGGSDEEKVPIATMSLSSEEKVAKTYLRSTAHAGSLLESSAASLSKEDLLPIQPLLSRLEQCPVSQLSLLCQLLDIVRTLTTVLDHFFIFLFFLQLSAVSYSV